MVLVKQGNVIGITESSLVAFEEEGVMDSGQGESMTGRVIATALKVLDEAESRWEVDHGSAELRDSFCLLRSYLGQLRRLGQLG
jgi:hypothetical protein